MILKAVLFPSGHLGRVFEYRPSFRRLILLSLLTALIGPVLSFYSLTHQLDYTTSRAFLYSITTYSMDLISLFLFSLILRLSFGVRFSEAFTLYVVVNLPLWLADVFDLSQELRFLSNLGFLYSLYVLWVGARVLALPGFRVISFHAVIYLLNSALSELIATNPVLLRILRAYPS